MGPLNEARERESAEWSIEPIFLNKNVWSKRIVLNVWVSGTLRSVGRKESDPNDQYLAKFGKSGWM